MSNAMKVFSLLVILLNFIQAHAQTESIPLVIGESLTINSEILTQERTINIYLPQDYSADSLETYHVIYLLDGSLDEDFIHIAGLIQFANFPWIDLAPKSIVVGISNIDRQHDYTYPSQNELDLEELPTHGGSEKFIEFIASELQPMIESHYKTDSTKTIIGQSLGGLLATEILFKRPDLFDNYVIVSPSLWWDDESLLKNQEAYHFSANQIYIAGGKEGEIMERTAKELYAVVLSKSTSKETVHYQFFEENDHGDVLHLAVYDALGKYLKFVKH